MECDCPFCERTTRHLVRQDDFASYAWCQECFRVHVIGKDRVAHVHLHLDPPADEDEPPVSPPAAVPDR
jgi:hypothetical protein